MRDIFYKEVYSFVIEVVITVDHVLHIFVYGGARGVMDIVVGNGHGDTSSNPERD